MPANTHHERRRKPTHVFDTGAWRRYAYVFGHAITTRTVPFGSVCEIFRWSRPPWQAAVRSGFQHCTNCSSLLQMTCSATGPFYWVSDPTHSDILCIKASLRPNLWCVSKQLKWFHPRTFCHFIDRSIPHICREWTVYRLSSHTNHRLLRLWNFIETPSVYPTGQP